MITSNSYKKRLKIVRDFLYIRHIKIPTIASKIGQSVEKTRKLLSGDTEDKNALHELEMLVLRTRR